MFAPTTYSVRFIDANGVEQRREFTATERSAAWAFMRECDAAGLRAGFPHPA